MTDVEVRKSGISGKGIFALRRFQSGETVLRWDTSELVARKDLGAFPEEQRHHLLDFDKDHLFVVQEPERYINHSCNPNTKMGNFCDVAIRTIEKGEEITSDYGGASFVEFQCQCGAENCRGLIPAASGK